MKIGRGALLARKCSFWASRINRKQMALGALCGLLWAGGGVMAMQPALAQSADVDAQQVQTNSETQTASGSKKKDHATQLLIDVLRKMQYFSADFKQFTQDAEGTILQEIRGRVHLARPQRFHWEIKSPYHQTLVVRDQKLWILDDDLEQVTVQSLSTQVGLTPAILLSGNPAQVQQHYAVSLNTLPDGAQQFVLKPRGEQGLFDQLNVVIHEGQLKEMDFRDTLGQRTAINFSEIALNEPFDEAVFAVSVPDGYDYIEDL